MQVKVKDSKGKILDIETQGTDTVEQLKKSVVEQFSLPEVSNIKLIFRGKLLEDIKSLSSYDIKQDSLVMLIVNKKPPDQSQKEKEYEEHKAVCPHNEDCRPNRRYGIH
jgi:hypothetical protein